MSALFYHYPTCSTCKKAKKWLDERGVEVDARHIVDEAPTLAQLQTYWRQSGLELKRFFNTSGGSYRDLDLKNRYDSLSDDERLALLAADGKLIKRPILVDGEQVLVGFKESEWQAAKLA